ncbi:3-dehydroquinate dehydratase [Nitrosospira briensis]|uniref:3-dehydroquinate dehydratase n=2 Tax=Nitrosospira briensis TaxID=35799 RepID=A0A1I5EL54_9PROT|nr:3-dehydroquinate dehydratase [Nitrosospira briensis]SFO33119.1 3-dehydroquinate dehydratase [Nitrosospira briensis]
MTTWYRLYRQTLNSTQCSLFSPITINNWTFGLDSVKLAPMKIDVTHTGKILVLHGPNLNLLGTREPETYGRTTLAEINDNLTDLAHNDGIKLTHFQSNGESELIERIQRAIGENVQFIIINPAAYTHTSIALRDALAATGIPFIEVHLSNIFARESFRQKSYFSDLARGVICGLGAKGYELALEYALAALSGGSSQNSENTGVTAK